VRLGRLSRKNAGTPGPVLRRCQLVAELVNSLEDDMAVRDDAELRGMTAEFRRRLARGERPAELAAEAFAVVREAAKRTIGQRPYDVQVMAAAAMGSGGVAEMAPGEGKTLAIALAAYLAALPGTGVHVFTANDFLAGRDAAAMAPVHEFLGLETGLLAGVLRGPDDRRTQYAADVTYGSTAEFCYDYLRDNLVTGAGEQVQRGHAAAIADDADVIAIDEACDAPRIAVGGTLLASVPTWDYLSLYQRLAGAAKVAVADAELYREIYRQEVVAIAPNRPVIRDDHPDVSVPDIADGLAAVSEQVAGRHLAGQPVLIGAPSAEVAEALSELLGRSDVRHEVLGGGDARREAAIFQQAGRRSAVTVVSETAGQGADIPLGGADRADRRAVAELGGLCVLGAGRLATPRAELRLRGFAGRRGDPGESQFFVWSAPHGPDRSAHSDRAARKIAEQASAELIDYVRLDSVLARQRREIYADRTVTLTDPALGDRDRQITLRITDEAWHQHLHTMTGLRDAAGAGPPDRAAYRREADRHYATLRASLSHRGS
jgi:preprotein translocase subunit SecA